MASRFVTPAAGVSAAPLTDALWLAVLHRIGGLAAHELKGVLNGVSVNLEVVRSRAAKPETPASAITTFANAASQQFDSVIDMTDALLGLTRAARGPTEIGATVRRIHALIAPAAKVEGRVLEVDGSTDELGVTTGLGSAVRLAIGAAMLAACDAASDVQCSGVGGTLRVESRSGDAIAPLDPDIVRAARDSGIEMRAEPSAISISFPR